MSGERVCRQLSEWRERYNQAIIEIRQLRGEELVELMHVRVSQDPQLSKEGFYPPLHPKRLESPLQFLISAYENSNPQFQAEFAQACSTILREFSRKGMILKEGQFTLTNVAHLIARLATQPAFIVVSQLVDQGILSDNRDRFYPETEQALFSALMNSSPPDQPLDPRFRKLLQEEDLDFWAAGFRGIAVKERSEAMGLVPELFRKTLMPDGTLSGNRNSLIWFLVQHYRNDISALTQDLSTLPPAIRVGFLLSLQDSGEETEKLNTIKEALNKLPHT